MCYEPTLVRIQRTELLSSPSPSLPREKLRHVPQLDVLAFAVFERVHEQRFSPSSDRP